MSKTQRVVLGAAILVLIAGAEAGEFGWSARTKIPKIDTGVGPAMAEMDGNLHLVYRGRESKKLYHVYHDGVRWSDEVHIPAGESRLTPAIAVVGSTLHLVHTGLRKRHLYHARYENGRWTSETKVEEHSPRTTPALVNYKDRLYMVYVGQKRSRLYMAAFDGVRWTDKVRIRDPKTRHRPALAVIGDTLHMVCLQDEDTSDRGLRLYHSSLKDGVWSAVSEINGVRSVDPPALVAHGKKLLVFRTMSSKIAYSEYDGRTWSAVKELTGQDGKFTPAVVRTGGIEPKLHIVYRSKKKERMWYSTGYER